MNSKLHLLNVEQDETLRVDDVPPSDTCKRHRVSETSMLSIHFIHVKRATGRETLLPP